MLVISMSNVIVKILSSDHKGCTNTLHHVHPSVDILSNLRWDTTESIVRIVSRDVTVQRFALPLKENRYFISTHLLASHQNSKIIFQTKK